MCHDYVKLLFKRATRDTSFCSLAVLPRPRRESASVCLLRCKRGIKMLACTQRGSWQLLPVLLPAPMTRIMGFLITCPPRCFPPVFVLSANSCIEKIRLSLMAYTAEVIALGLGRCYNNLSVVTPAQACRWPRSLSPTPASPTYPPSRLDRCSLIHTRSTT